LKPFIVTDWDWLESLLLATLLVAVIRRQSRHLRISLGTDGQPGLRGATFFDTFAQNLLLDKGRDRARRGNIVTSWAIKAIFFCSAELGVVHVLFYRDTSIV
jgi:hypothetical protein